MDKHTEIRHSLSWEGEGRFEAEIVNGQISQLNFSEIGKGETDCGKYLSSINFKFLQQTKDNLIDLFNFLEEENKRLGYSFPVDHLKNEV